MINKFFQSTDLPLIISETFRKAILLAVDSKKNRLRKYIVRNNNFPLWMLLSLLSCCGFDISSNRKGWNDKQGSPIKVSGLLNEWQQSFDKNGSTNTYIYLLEGLIQTFKANRFSNLDKLWTPQHFRLERKRACHMWSTADFGDIQTSATTMNSSEFVNVFFVLFLLCAIQTLANTLNQRRLSSFFVDSFEPLLCQEHSTSDTDLSWKE